MREMRARLIEAERYPASLADDLEAQAMIPTPPPASRADCDTLLGELIDLVGSVAHTNARRPWSHSA